MLILDAIESARRAGLLIAARPVVPWAGESRVFLMCRPLHDAIQAGRASSDEGERRRWAALEATIGSFVEGGLMTANLLKQLEPPKFEHWILRNRSPRPGLRVFGRFAMPDVFVGTHVERRDTLGGKWSAQFEHHKLICEQHWEGLALGEAYSDAPHFRYDHYITENARRVPGV